MIDGSALNKLILEVVNLGLAAEFYTLRTIYNKLLNQGIDVSFDKISLDDINSKADEYVGGASTEDSINPKDKKLEKEAEAFADTLINNLYFRNEYLSPENKKLSKIVLRHLGKAESGLSSGDVSFNFFYDDNTNKVFKTSLKRGNPLIYRTTKYKTADEISQVSYKDMDTKEFSDLVKKLGGGPKKIFSLFGYSGDKEIDQAISTDANKQHEACNYVTQYMKFDKILYKNFSSGGTGRNIDDAIKLLAKSRRYQKLKKLTNEEISSIKENNLKFFQSRREKKEKIKNYFNSFFKYLEDNFSEPSSEESIKLFDLMANLISRADADVKAVIDIENIDVQNEKKSATDKMYFTELAKAYCGHINSFRFRNEISNKNPTLKIFANSQPIQSLSNDKDNTIKKNIRQKIIQLAKQYELTDKTTRTNKSKKQLSSLTSFFGIKNLMSVDINNDEEIQNALKKFIESSNKIINLLISDRYPLYSLGYSFQEGSINIIDYLIKSKNEEIKKNQINKTPEKEESEEKGENTKDSVFFKKNAGFITFTKVCNALYEMEKSSGGEGKKLISLIADLFITLKSGNTEKPNVETFNEYIKQFYKSFLLESNNKQKILNKIKKKINSLNKEELGIISVTPSNKSEAAIVVRCKDKKNIDSARSAVKSAIDELGLSTNNRIIAKFEPSTESTEVSMNDGSGGVYIVYKYDIGSREGLALEHVMGLLLTKKVTPELKNRLDLPPEASKKEVKQKLKTDYADVLSTAFQGKKLIDEKIGEITDARSEGSRNSKADLILTTADGHTYGLSIKLVTEEGREVRFTYNKNLGYGDDEDETLVKSPNGRPWWLIGRQNFAKKLGRQFKGNPEDLDPPGWMTKAKESKSDLYKEAMEETYAALREVFVGNLKRMKLKQLVDMVNEAHTGGEQEEEYEKLYVLTSDAEGIRLEAKGHEEPDIEKIKMSGIKKSDIVKTDGARIIIDIPGMSPLTIHGLKFHSNMLSSNREDLKIKTR